MQLRIILLQNWIYLVQFFTFMLSENWSHMFTLNFSHYIYPEQQKTTANKKNSQIDLRINAI